MLECLSLRGAPPPQSLPSTPASLPPQAQGNSTEPTPPTSTASSPPPDISLEYERAVQARSYTEIRSKIQAHPQAQVHHLDPNHAAENQDQDQDQDEDEDEDSHHRNVLQPDRDSVRDALSLTRPDHPLTRLVSSYFDHSESTGTLCLVLHRSVRQARAIYAPLHDLLAVLPDGDSSGSFSQHLCDRAFDLFLEFDGRENPFLFSGSHDFAGICGSFSDLKREIDRRRRRSHARIRLFKRFHAGCMICLVVTAVGAVVSAALVTAHAVAGFAVVAGAPFCSDSCLPKRKERKESKELTRWKHLDAASKGTMAMIDNVRSLVDLLQSEVESHGNMIRFALEGGRERHRIQEVLKQLRKKRQGFEKLLDDLEEQIFLCFSAVNKARLLLLQEIHAFAAIFS